MSRLFQPSREGNLKRDWVSIFYGRMCRCPLRWPVIKHYLLHVKGNTMLKRYNCVRTLGVQIDAEMLLETACDKYSDAGCRSRDYRHVRVSS